MPQRFNNNAMQASATQEEASAARPEVSQLPEQQLPEQQLPDPIAQEIQQPYILNGLTYQSNNPYVIERDDAGNIKLYESGSNQRLIIESSIENITNESFVQVVDTQFQYFKFPVKTVSAGSSAVTDLDFDISSDPYEGRLIRKRGGGGDRYYVENGVKRPFRIAADSTWAIKKNLPPFNNIESKTELGDDGKNNFGGSSDGLIQGYNNTTLTSVPVTIFSSYEDGPDYGPADAFPDEPWPFSKFVFALDNYPVDGGVFINGPNQTRMLFSKGAINGGAELGFRYSEFNTDDITNSYFGISNVDSSATPATPTYEVTPSADLDILEASTRKYDKTSNPRKGTKYYLIYTTLEKKINAYDQMQVKLRDIPGAEPAINISSLFETNDGVYSGFDTLPIPAPSSTDYKGWALPIQKLIAKLKSFNSYQVTDTDKIASNVSIRFEVTFLGGDENSSLGQTLGYFTIMEETDYNAQGHATATNMVVMDYEIGSSISFDAYERLKSEGAEWTGRPVNSILTETSTNYNKYVEAINNYNE